MIFVQYLLNGIAFGSIYALVAVSFVVIYRGTRVLNFAQGEFMMAGSYVALFMMLAWNIPFLLTIFLALFTNALLGMLLERGIFRKFVGEPVFTVVMVTIGLSSAIKGLVGLIGGHDLKKFPLPFENSTILLGDITITRLQIITFVVTVLVLVALLLFYRYSKWGIAMRGAASDQDTAQLMGVGINQVNRLTWSISALISVVAGLALATSTFLQPSQGHFALKVFPAIVFGGLDSIPGAVIGGFILGMVESLAGGILGPVLGGNVKDLIAYVFLMVLLVLMPYGLFGTREIERV